jgi:uncharacterized spore protein YtfJ
MVLWWTVRVTADPPTIHGGDEMQLDELITNTRTALTVERVFGEPYERDAVTIIPAAVVRGGAGGGEGDDDEHGHGQGGGFAVSERPIGVYRVAGDDVRWVPAIDTTKVILMGQVVVIAALLLLRALVRR